MSLSAEEFETSLALFLGRDVAPGTRRIAEALEQGRVEITYERQQGVRLGGLLSLPRALVTLSFHGVPEVARSIFLRRFEIAFQRGGG